MAQTRHIRTCIDDVTNSWKFYITIVHRPYIDTFSLEIFLISAANIITGPTRKMKWFSNSLMSSNLNRYTRCSYLKKMGRPAPVSPTCVRMCVRTCIRGCVRTCVSTCVHGWICVHVCMYIHVGPIRRPYVGARLDGAKVRLCVCVSVCICVCACGRVCGRLRARMRVRAYVDAQVPVCA